MPSPKIGDFDSELVADFWQAVATQGRMNLHVILHHGRNTHHISEAIFKACGPALRAAVERDPAIDRRSPRPRGLSDRARPIRSADGNHDPIHTKDGRFDMTTHDTTSEARADWSTPPWWRWPSACWGW